MAAYMVLCGRGALFAAAMASILLHEGAHALAAASMGDCPLSIEITPLGACMRLEDDARLSPARRLVMLAAGPAATLLLCATAVAGTVRGLLPVSVGSLLFRVNAALLALNLLPCLPLDGGRLLALLLDSAIGTQRSRHVMRFLSMMMGVACLLLSIVTTWKTGAVQITLAACGCVMLYAAHNATITAAMAELSQWMERKIRMERRGIQAVRTVAVMDHTPLRLVMMRFPPRAWSEIMLLESGTLRTLGFFSETELINAYLVSPGESCKILAEQARKASRA